MLVGNHSCAEGRAVDNIYLVADASHLPKEVVTGTALLSLQMFLDHLVEETGQL